MELNDTQVLEQLKYKRARLKTELDKVNIAIKAFEKDIEIDPLDIAPYLFDDIKPVDEEIAIATLLYNPHASFEKKVIFVLGKLGKASAKDITQYLLRIDNRIKDEVALHNRITYVSSRLFNTHQIKAEKVGKANVYSLKNET